MPRYAGTESRLIGNHSRNQVDREYQQEETLGSYAVISSPGSHECHTFGTGCASRWQVGLIGTSQYATNISLDA